MRNMRMPALVTGAKAEALSVAWKRRYVLIPKWLS